MSAINLYFQVHQPFRLKEFSFFHIGRDYEYENHDLNLSVLNKVADKCYIPAGKLLLELLQKHEGKFKLNFSLSGVFLEQIAQFRPDVLEIFKALYQTGYVEFLSETYYHSLAFHYSEQEFDRQVAKHTEALQKYLGATPSKVFRNTELIYSNELAKYLYDKGFEGVLSEGADNVLETRSPNFVYESIASPILVLLRNYKLTDDIAFRFSDKNWKEWPLTVEKYTQFLETEAENGAEVVNLFMDYETLGEHQWEDTGIFTFFTALVDDIVAHSNLHFATSTEVIQQHKSQGTIDAPRSISWADLERDLSAWRSNSLQYEAFNKVYDFEKAVLAKNDENLLHTWGKLQTSDHFYYMSTKQASDGDVHSYFSPYHSPYDAYLYYLNILSDFELRIRG